MVITGKHGSWGIAADFKVIKWSSDGSYAQHLSVMWHCVPGYKVTSFTQFLPESTQCGQLSTYYLLHRATFLTSFFFHVLPDIYSLSSYGLSNHLFALMLTPLRLRSTSIILPQIIGTRGKSVMGGKSYRTMSGEQSLFALVSIR